MKAALILVTWLDRGDLTKRNVNNFYGMIQCTNSQVRRLLSEKQNQEEALQKMKDNFRNIFEGILHQCKHHRQFNTWSDVFERNLLMEDGKRQTVHWNKTFLDHCYWGRWIFLWYVCTLGRCLIDGWIT